MTKVEKKNREKLFLAQNCLKRIMNQLLDYTKNDKKSRKFENYFVSELSKANNSPTFRIHQKMTKNREKKIEKLFWVKTSVSEGNSSII